MRLLLLLLLAFATAIARAEILDVDCEGLEKACCDGQSLPGDHRSPGDIGDDAKTGCTAFGSKKKECSNRGNIVCCGAIHGDIGTQCKDVEDEQITCPEPALAYRKHKRWSLPLKRALFHKRADFCDQRAVRQAPKPIDNTFGFPAFTDIGGAVNFIHELSKSDDKGTKSYPGSTTTFDPAAPVDFLPEFPANNQLDYTSDPYAQQNFKA